MKMASVRFENICFLAAAFNDDINLIHQGQRHQPYRELRVNHGRASLAGFNHEPANQES